MTSLGYQAPSSLAQKLDFAQLEGIWTLAGGSRQLAPTMAAIALAESGGNPQALNNNPATGDYSVGLWQINYFGSLLSSRTQKYGPPSALRSPLANARAAVDLAGNGSGLTNWTTYTSGAYKAYLGNASGVSPPNASQPTTQGPPAGLPPPGPVSGLTKEQVKSIANALLNGQISASQADGWWPGANVHGNTWGTFGGLSGILTSTEQLIAFITSWRFAEVVAGFVLLVVGLLLLGRQFGLNPPGAAAAARIPGA